ncbi:MAG: sulfatase-like hydrolase/transferase [Planctomycetota bacterium]
MSEPSEPASPAQPHHPVWTWPFPNRLAAIVVPALSGLELLGLAVAEDHLDYTDAPTLLTAALLTFVTWWFASWFIHFVTWMTKPMIHRRLTRWIRHLCFVAVAAIAVAAWIGSWWLYLTTGRFASFSTGLFLVQAAGRWEMLWTPAASQRTFIVLSAILSIAAATALVLARPRIISDAIAAVRPRGLLRFGYSLLVMYVLWIGLTAWCMSGFSSLEKLERRESFTQKTSPMVTLALSSIAAANIEAVPADSLSADELVPIAEAKRKRERSLQVAGRGYNVVIIQIESLRSDCIASQHHGIEITPHINRLAESGIRFANAYTQSTHSNFADPCIASSLYPLRGHLPRPYRRGDPYPKTLIYDLLKPRGYATAIISSQNEAWFSMDQFYESPNLDLIFDPQRVEGHTYVDVRDWGMAREALGGTLKGGKFIDSFTADSAIEWMGKQRGEGKPFYLQMNLQSSHFPYPLPKDVPRPFEPHEMNFPASFVEYPKEKAHVVRNAYYNAIAECDRQVGRIITALKELDQFDDTILIVVGENGESFFEDGVVTHGGPPSQVQLHVAWVMSVPGEAAERVEDYPVELVDVVPTTLGLLGLPADANHQGINVLAEDRPRLSERFLFFHVNSPHGHAVATLWGGRWKFVSFDPGTWDYVDDPTGRGEALFDIHSEQAEANNRILERPKIAAILRSRLERWRMRQLAYYQYPHLHMSHCPPQQPLGPAER